MSRNNVQGKAGLVDEAQTRWWLKKKSPIAFYLLPVWTFTLSSNSVTVGEKKTTTTELLEDVRFRSREKYVDKYSYTKKKKAKTNKK